MMSSYSAAASSAKDLFGLQAVHHPVPVSGACHGFANVLSFILSQLGWGAENPNDLTLSTPDGSLQLFALSNNAFKEWVARAARTTLMLQQKTRQEFGPVPANHMVDINLTRFLLDSKFRSDDEFAFLQPHLKNLPPNWKYSTNLLRMAQCGRVFTAPRLRAVTMPGTSSGSFPCSRDGFCRSLHSMELLHPLQTKLLHFPCYLIIFPVSIIPNLILSCCIDRISLPSTGDAGAAEVSGV